MELPATTTELAPDKIQAWGKVGLRKQILSEQQTRIGLELQKILLDADDSITGMETALAAYRKKHKEMVDLGQTFRSLIDEKVLQQSIEIEKTYSTGSKTQAAYPKYKAMEDSLLQKKIDQDKKNSAAIAKKQEELNYVAHIKNQLEILVADLKKRSLEEIFRMHRFFLEKKVKNPDLATLKEAISEMKFGKPVTYDRKYLTDDEAKAINASIPKPNLKELQGEMLKVIDEKFLTYDNDLKAGNIEQVDLFHQEALQAVETDKEIAVGINTLTAQAGTAAGIVTEGKGLKKTLEVVVEETEEWAIKVIAAFLRYPLARQHIRSKQWSNVAIKQMAAALGAYATETEGKEKDNSLTYVEKVK